MKLKYIILTVLCVFSLTAESACIVLLHGLARTENSMNYLQDQLENEGYKVVNIGYPSREHAIDALAKKAIVPALQLCNAENEINFVTHSLGGILVRYYLGKHTLPQLKHVVMLAPPNKGSEVVDTLGNFPGFELLNGDAGLQLGTGVNSIPNQLGNANFDLGIIAGSNSINWILSSLIPGTDDGKVSVENTKLDGMNDHIVLPVSHPFIMKDDEAISQVIYYLKNGEFYSGPNEDLN